MIDISPKALRFARLAAEAQVSFAGDLQVDILRDLEKNSRRSSGLYFQVREQTAAFCLRVLDAFRRDRRRFESEEWDGNDLLFIEAICRDLDARLAHPALKAI